VTCNTPSDYKSPYILDLKEIMASKKTVTAKAHLRLIAITIITLLSGALSGQAIESATFDEVEALLTRAREENAEVFSPQNFKSGQAAYEKALSARQAGKSESRIQKKLDQAFAFLEEAQAVVQLTKSHFPDLVAAYQAALAIETPDRVPELHKEAMVPFKKAVKKIEGGDPEKAMANAREAATLFRKAELEVIRTEILASVYELKAEAETAGCSLNTPGLYEEAVNKIRETEDFLEENRYKRDTALLMADEAIATLTHAIFVNQWINRAQQNPGGWEDLILQFEWYLDDISARLELSPDFNRDWTFVIESILKSIRTLQDELRYTEKQLADRDEIIGQLEAQLNDLQGRSGQYAAELELKRQQILEKQQYEAKFKRLTSIFSSEEGEIFRASAGGRNQIVIRLTSMNFKSGSARIEPDDFALLDKVHQVIIELPYWKIEIQGHTDSRGNERSNLGLSQARAQAVKDYFINTYRINEANISAVGYGESRPIASNENAEGRAQNRRIDILLEEP
jgi:outer membrane protein OmpA-like peptidoglycan-associated protein